MDPEILRHHVRFNVWATNRLLETAARLAPEVLSRDFGTADRSIQGTLGHILLSETIWLARLTGNEQPGGKNADLPLPVLHERFASMHAEWTDWAAGLGGADQDRTINYRDLSGNPFSHRIWQIVLHVVNHSSHHRGQVSGFMRAAGHAPPSVDLIMFVRMGC